jgi:predicted esterase
MHKKTPLTGPSSEKRVGFASLSAAAALLCCGCTSNDKPAIGQSKDGQACKQVSDCLAGLSCSKGSCQPVTSTLTGVTRGKACTSDGDCLPDLVCGPQGACGPTAGAKLGERCGLSEDCADKRVCHGNDGICVDPSNPNPNDARLGRFGAKAYGEACLTFTDCQKPYLCAVGLPSPTCDKLPLYLGPNCSQSDEEQGAFRAYFELPPETLPDDFEFDRLPFPSDIRVVNGHISLRGHPSPGKVFGIDVAGNYLRAVEEDSDGFATNGAVFFRFTDPPSPASICLDATSIYPEVKPVTCLPGITCVQPEQFCPTGARASVYLVNIDRASPAYNHPVPVQLALKRERSQYLCQNALGIAPLDGAPLLAGTTYAAIVTRAVLDVHGSQPIQDRDFVRVLGGDASLSAPVLAATEPLRAWLRDQSIDPSSIAAATVFTTGHPDRFAAPLHKAVQDLPTPTFAAGAFECSSAPTTTIYCHLPSGVGRGCDVASPAFYEVHGTYKGPVFQQGTRPYWSDGGALNIGASGKPEKVAGKDETMCFALTVPKGQSKPTAGWPVVIVAHGTGGNYRSFIVDQTAARLSALGFAVLSFDNVMHGPRQDPEAEPASWQPSKWQLLDPGSYFFNVLNPRAARDNVLQGAVDLFYLTRLLREAVPPPASETGLDISFDRDQVYFFGHSQGTVIAPAYLAEETKLQAAVFSGAGADIVLSILNKRQPQNLASIAGAAFSDRNLSRIHPMMSLLGLLFGPADALSYASTMVSNPAALRPARPFLMFWGAGDDFAPDQTQEAMVRSMGIPLVSPVPQLPAGMVPVDSSTTTLSAGAVQLLPDCSAITDPIVCAGVLGCNYSGSACSGSFEGHFILFDHPVAQTIFTHFLTTAKAGAAEIKR